MNSRSGSAIPIAVALSANPPVRIGFVGHQASKEGAGRFMLEEIEYLLAHDVRPFVVFPKDGPLCADLRRLGVETAFVPFGWWNKPRGLETPEEYEEALKAGQSIARLFLRWQVDIAYTNTIVAGPGALAASFAGVPHVWHLHEFSYLANAIDMALPRRDLARLMDLTANLVFFNSRAVASEWNGLLPAEKTRVVYNWTPDGPERSTNEEPTAEPLTESMLNGKTFVAVSVGSIIPFKRHIDGVRSVGALIREGLDVGLLVIGPALHPAAHAEIVSVINENGWSDRIRVLGYCETPASLTRRADVALVCSDSESFGRITIEAMSQRKPVIGANFGGTAEIVRDGVNGLLYPPGDVEALSNRLRLVVSDPELRERLVAGAEQTSQNFRGPERSMAPVLADLRALVGQRNPSWPLGTLIEAGYSFGLGQIAAANRSLPRKVMDLLRRTARGTR